MYKESSTCRNVKSCPKCHSISITHKRRKGYYQCEQCLETFQEPAFKQVIDRRNLLTMPPTLRKIADSSTSG